MVTVTVQSSAARRVSS